MTEQEAIGAAIKIVGGVGALAAEINAEKGQKRISAQAVGQWTRCPKNRVLAVEAAVRRAKQRLRDAPTRFDLRQDLYPRSKS